jgi:hypothetical protein
MPPRKGSDTYSGEMAQTTFYAARSDEIELLRFVFEQTDCEVYESHSRYDQDLRRFSSVADVCAAFDIGDDRPRETRMILFDLWSPSTGGRPIIAKRDLKLEGVNFRYEVAGWGLFRLEFGGCGDDAVGSSWFAHNTEKRARRMSAAYDDLGPPDAWRWDAVTTIGRRVIRHIRNQLAVAKAGSAAVLPQADALRRAGWSLCP